MSATGCLLPQHGQDGVNHSAAWHNGKSPINPIHLRLHNDLEFLQRQFSTDIIVWQLVSHEDVLLRPAAPILTDLYNCNRT